MDPFTIALMLGATASAGSAAYGANKASKATKEGRRLSDIASQTQESATILEQFLSQLTPGSEEYNQFLAEASALVQRTYEEGDQQSMIRELGQKYVAQHGAKIAAGGPATPLEARTDLAFKGYRQAAAPTPEESAVFNSLRGQDGPTPTDAIFKEIVDRARNPNAYYESTLRPELSLAEDAVKRRAAERGVLGSGIELENLGRAGVDLSIKSARERENFRTGQLGEFKDLFNVGQGLREREIGVEKDLTNLQLGRESAITGYLGRSGMGARGVLQDFYGERADDAQSELARLQDEEAAAAEAMQASFSKLGGAAASAAMPAFGGLPAGAGGTFQATNGTRAPIGVDEALALARSGYGGRIRPNLDTLLSRQGGY